jgi:hypothetical protein
MNLRVHKIASVAHRLGLGRDLALIAEARPARVGDVVAVRAQAEKRIYGDLELADGRMAKIFRGDCIVGALGSRRALKGFVGGPPERVAPGDRLAILNLGGLIGVPQISQHPDLGAPCPVEFLGFVAGADGQVATVASAALPMPQATDPLPPLVAVSGTCMSTGKTRAACEIIHELASAGFAIHGGKATGVACLRDTLVMGDHGALRTASFLDFGLVSTVAVEGIARYARALLNHLAAGGPDLVVLELGDGILGDYGVLEVLRDLRDAVRVHVLCAPDPVAAWGGREILTREGLGVDIVSGPCTDSVVGTAFVTSKLGLPALNACAEPHALGEAVQKMLEATT